MKFSLIGVQRHPSQTDGIAGTIDGNWIQNHVGTLETAIAKANGDKIDVAEVTGIGTGHMEYFLKRLDTQRNGAKSWQSPPTKPSAMPRNSSSM